MTEEAEAEPVTLQLLRGMLRESHDLLVGNQQRIIDQLDRLEGKIDEIDAKNDQLASDVEGVDRLVLVLASGQRTVLEVQEAMLDSQHQMLGQLSHAAARIDGIEVRLGGLPARTETGDLDVGMRAEVRLARSHVQRVDARLARLHDDVRAIAIAVEARSVSTAQEGGC